MQPAAAPATPVLSGDATAAAVLPVAQVTMAMRRFHERMGNVNVKDCAALAAQQGVRLTETVDFACAVCATAKQRNCDSDDRSC